MKSLFEFSSTNRENGGLQTFLGAALALMILLAGPQNLTAGTIHYEGSATVGKLIDMARDEYGKSTIMMNVTTQSKGGLDCVLRGSCDVGGVAGELDPEWEKAGVVATLIGRDTLAVIVNAENPVKYLTMSQLKAIFTGGIGSWKALGGPDHPIEALIARPNSTINKVFREKVLEGAPYKGVTVNPYAGIPLRVSGNPWAIGQISELFIQKEDNVRAVAVDGQEPKSDNLQYPIARSLYLLTKGAPVGEVKDFIDWLLSEQGQKLVTRILMESN